MVHLLKKGSGIHIKKSHEGRFTEYCGGNVTEECIRRGKNSPDPKIRKQAVFAQNARKFKHQDGGPIYGASQIQANRNLSQQWKQQQEMAAQNFNQGIEQKKYLDEMKRMQDMQKSQALGQSIGNTVGTLMGRGMQAMVQNIKERRDGGEEGQVKGNDQQTMQQPTTSQQPTLYQMPQLPTSLQGINNMMRSPFAIPQQMPTMMNGGNIERLIRKIDRHG